jgi:hypothetical protein
MAKKNMDYNSINFKNKDVDKLSTRFGGPGDGLIANVKDMGNKLKNAPANTKDVEAFKTLSRLRTAFDYDPTGAMIAESPLGSGLTNKEKAAYAKGDSLAKKFQPAKDMRSDMEKIYSDSQKKKNEEPFLYFGKKP